MDERFLPVSQRQIAIFISRRRVAPALAADKIVLSDRYVESSLVLQRLDGCSLEFIWNINSKVLVPDLSVILVADPVILEQRLASERTGFNRFECSKARGQEMCLYHEAAEFIGRREFNVLLLENGRQSVDDNSERIAIDIQKLLQAKEEIL